MGKKRHAKDRAYLTTTEWKEEWGGFKAKGKTPFKRLPFNCCAISFQPFEDAVRAGPAPAGGAQSPTLQCTSGALC